MQKIVLFDFDGVLVDSFELSYQAAQGAGSPLSREQQRKIFEGNFYETIKKLKIAFSAQDEEKFYSHYTPALLKTLPMLGIGESLLMLTKDYELVLISSMNSSPIRQYLEMNGFSGYFTSIRGGDVHKSKVEKIKKVLAEYKAEPKDCIFITDTLGDIKEAKKCNVQSIGVTWGFHERERLEKGKPYKIIDTVPELVPAVESFFAGELEENK